MRPSKDENWLDEALVRARRSTCLRSKYGAVIIKRDAIVSSGYNGAAKKSKHCSDLGICARDASGLTRYDLCRSVHAEANSIIQGDFDKMEGSTLYLSRIVNPSSHPFVEPCTNCKRMILNAGIIRVVCRSDDGSVIEFDPLSWVDQI